jgi:cytochrome c
MRFVNLDVIGSLILGALVALIGLQGASAASGASVFKRYCSVCHSVEEGKNKLGPSLANVVGRHSASLSFSYSGRMKTLGVVWTPENLDRFLTDPSEMVPGTPMTFPGVKNDDERKALIDYLAKLGG